MVIAERRRGKMDSTFEHEERLAAAVKADRLYKAFEIEMTPEEAGAFAVAVQKDRGRLDSLISSINGVIPPVNFGNEHPQTGKPHHTYRVGRERGLRLLKIEIFKGFFQVDYDFMVLMEVIHALGVAAGAQVTIDAGNNSYSIVMLWLGGGL